MPNLTTFKRIERTEQRISELTAGKEIDAKHITVLLSKARQKEFDAEWKRQQALRKQKKPAAVVILPFLRGLRSRVMRPWLTAVSV